MRALLAFITCVAVMMAVSALFSADWPAVATAGLVAAVSGALLWRDLKSPDATRKAGQQAQIVFSFEPGHGIENKGTFALVKSHGSCWNVALDRQPERGDMAMHGTVQRGWVWLGADGLPEKVRISGAIGWQSWPVHSAAAAEGN